MAGCIAYAQNGHIYTSALKWDVTIVFLDSDFLRRELFAKFGHKIRVMLHCACAKRPYFHFRSKI